MLAQTGRAAIASALSRIAGLAEGVARLECFGVRASLPSLMSRGMGGRMGSVACAEEMVVSMMVGEWFPEVSRAAKRAQCRESRIGLASLGLGGSGG
jgi:hypothetical protein